MMRFAEAEIAELLGSGEFDPSWYGEEYPDVAASGLAPAEHYLWIGRRMGRRPLPPAPRPVPPAAQSAAQSAAFEMPAVDAALRRADARTGFDARSYFFANPGLASVLSSDDAHEHWRRHGMVESRPGSGVSRFADRKLEELRPLSTPPRVAFFGPISARTGLGTAARGYARALANLDIELEVIDSTRSIYRDWPGEIAIPQTRPDILILHHNADSPANLFALIDRNILDETYVIGIWVWELMAFQAQWIDAFTAVDEVWVPSAFCAESVSVLAPRDFPVRVVPHVVEIEPAHTPIGRKFFGIPAAAFTFLHSFDASSSLERKNPEAVLRAFVAAFADDARAFLVVKYHSSRACFDLVRALKKKYAGANIMFLDFLLTDEQANALQDVTDCLVSPHRAEGFGLNIAEMMARGKPVIATGYSGNLEFCNSENCILLPFRFTEVTHNAGPYPAGPLWAEPDHAALVTAMQRLVETPGLAAEVGEAARQSIAGQLSLDAISQVMGSALSDITEHWNSRRFAIVANWPERRQLAWRHPLAFAPSGFEGKAWPLISVIVPVYNISAALLDECVASVLAQSYPFWELCLCDDASTNPETVALVEALRGKDQRIRIRRLARNGGISVATNAAVEMASGDYLAFLDNDDTIECDALEEYARAILANPGCELLYCDEDKIDTQGQFIDHYFKPDWSPEHLESCMYVLHMLVVRKQVFAELGGYREEYSGAQDYDLALRISRREGLIVHIPKVLYHWRMIPGSAAAQVDAKPVALINASRALADYARQRYGPDARVEPGMHPGLFRICRGGLARPPVTLVILTNSVTREVAGRGVINLPENFLRSILGQTTYDNYRVLMVSDGELTPGCRELLAESGGREVVYHRPGPQFNFADKANFSVLSADTDLVVLLNDDMEVRSGDWLDALVDQILKDDVGAVGAHLSYGDGRIQHVGMIMGVNETTAHIYHGHADTTAGYNCFPVITRNYSAVTGACLATRRSLFEMVGGLDTEFSTDFNDTDYCLKLRELGYRIVYTPFARLYHFENQSFERTSQKPSEKALFLSRWADVVACDPYYNRNLRNDSLTFEHRPDAWPIVSEPNV
jgi:GT2 family glycosyltransferase/glycosyltransferase involved in cell wall biosynthesis